MNWKALTGTFSVLLIPLSTVFFTLKKSTIFDKSSPSSSPSSEIPTKLRSAISTSTPTQHSLPSQLARGGNIQSPIQPQKASNVPWFYWVLGGLTLFGALRIGYSYLHQHFVTKKSTQKNQSKSRKSHSPRSNPTKYKGFLNRYANHCFANSLLVCLMHLPGFQEKICRAATASKKNSNLVFKSLATLFTSINQSPRTLNTEIIEACKEDFCKEIMKSSPKIQIFHEKGGDSRSLFQIIYQNIPTSLGCFSFTQEKTVTCDNCLNQGRQIIPKKFVENYSMLNIQEDLYFQNEPNNPQFLSQTELRTCKACGPSTPHRKQVTLRNFPDTLALRIGDTPGFKQEQAGPWLRLSFRNNEEGEQVYKFIGGVYNTNKGYNGFHSVAYIYKEEEDGGRPFLCYNDTDVRRVRFEEIRGYPKLMFYAKESLGNVALKVMEEREDEKVAKNEEGLGFLRSVGNYPKRMNSDDIKKKMKAFDEVEEKGYDYLKIC